jgi:serine/threonine-protein kinase RsbW
MSEHRWTWQCNRVIPSNSDAGQSILDEIVRRLELNQWGPHDVFSVRLAVEEAIVNAMKHGNRHDPSKHVHVACSVSPSRMRIEIADEGPGFDPKAVPDPTDEEHIDSPSGRGIMLMRSFMSSVSFNESGNQVVMEKCLHGCR